HNTADGGVKIARTMLVSGRKGRRTTVRRGFFGGFCPVMAACEPCAGGFHAGGRFWTAACGILAIFAGLRTRVSLRGGSRMR
ncbi:hypothetical protein GGI1_16549, partial [Acidithiobacillus sp. GGI-221]